MAKKNNKKILKSLLKKNKNGIPVFDGRKDFISLFENSASVLTEKKTSEETLADPDSPGICPENKSGSPNMRNTNSIYHRSDMRDKHGIKILDPLENFAGVFQGKKEEDNFSVLLDSSLKGKNLSAMMREKKDKLRPVPVPMGKRIKRYPPPQETLDLHGCTASVAETKAEIYMRTCSRKGIFTIRIIVGRGLHSEWGPVLPDIIEDLLIKLKKDDIVLWFKWDRKKKSQSGSLIVYIKQ